MLRRFRLRRQDVSLPDLVSHEAQRGAQLTDGWELDYWQIKEVYEIVSTITTTKNFYSDIISTITTISLIDTLISITSDIYPTVNINLPLMERIVRY